MSVCGLCIRTVDHNIFFSNSLYVADNQQILTAGMDLIVSG